MFLLFFLSFSFHIVLGSFYATRVIHSFSSSTFPHDIFGPILSVCCRSLSFFSSVTWTNMTSKIEKKVWKENCYVSGIDNNCIKKAVIFIVTDNEGSLQQKRTVKKATTKEAFYDTKTEKKLLSSITQVHKLCFTETSWTIIGRTKPCVVQLCELFWGTLDQLNHLVGVMIRMT